MNLKTMSTLSILFFTLLALSQGLAFGGPIPYDDFVKITEAVLDAVDEVQVVFSGSPTIIEARVAMNKLSAAMKKYDRYPKDENGKSIQNKIILKLAMAEYTYKIFLITEAVFDSKMKEDADNHVQEARNLFTQYRTKKPSSK